MSKQMALTVADAGAVASRPSLTWQTALKTFLDTLSSPRTRRAYRHAVTEAMEAMGVDVLTDLAPPILAEYRAGLVAILEAGAAAAKANQGMLPAEFTAEQSAEARRRVGTYRYGTLLARLNGWEQQLRLPSTPLALSCWLNWPYPSRVL